ncbi:hypothetical protein [Aquimarina macrocephali]|uniref:hypothetical protein n=1 Tax=Aquimarina macrocephali TaxID=666563 RepID=UPI00046593D6|nr:hypothetical protein [Aquimarina macrocephali]
MKNYKTIFVTIFLFSSIVIFSQQPSQNKGDEKFDYSTVGHFPLWDYDAATNAPDTGGGFKIPTFGTRFVLKNKIKHPSEDYNIYIIDVLNWPEKDKKDQVISYKMQGNTTYINVDDNDKRFWIKAEEFNRLLDEKYIVKRYYLSTQFAYGASLSVPFKIRPKTDDFNMKITPEIMLGGYLGLKHRLNRYKDIYIHFPVVTFGVTTLGINENNTINESTTTTETPDGLVLGRTFSFGTILEYKSFQIGLIGGFDRASGEIGKNWAYNDKFWYSVGIGYSFFERATGD